MSNMLHSNIPILITGCQRSGTTLTNLILDSHPDINGIDEIDFQASRITEYLNDPVFSPAISWKLPAISHNFAAIKIIPGLKVLWCVRDPRSVVASMVKLRLSINTRLDAPWSLHPLGGIMEINNLLSALKINSSDWLKPALRRLQQITQKYPADTTHYDAVLAGALCYRLKNELPAIYQKHGINFHIVKYEDLVRNPKHEVRNILTFIGLPWNEQVLEHHLLHAGISVGNTDNTRSIDSNSIEKWISQLTKDDLAIISQYCMSIAKIMGYEFWSGPITDTVNRNLYALNSQLTIIPSECESPPIY